MKLLYNNLRLHNALFVPYLGANLLSSLQIISNWFYALYNHKYYTIYKQLDNKSVFKAERLNNKHLQTTIQAVNNLANSTEQAYLINEYKTIGVDAEDQLKAHFNTNRLY